MLKTPSSINICLVAVPETVASILIGLHDMFKMFDEVVHGNNPFKVTIAGLDDRPFSSPSGIILQPYCGFREIQHTDIIIVPALLLNGNRWVTGRYDGIVRWMKDRHGDGALLCSACSGILLQAETGLYDNYEATLHWAYAEAFQRCFPKVKLRLEKTLLSTGSKNELVMSGGSSSWHDLALYLVARLTGPAAANSVAKFFLMQWHEDGQAPYIVFDEKKDHGDGAILNAQAWLSENAQVANPLESMIENSGLPERSFRRRFSQATGYSPTVYVQKFRVEDAKRQLESTDLPVDEISHRVGYEESAFFRRIFKRTTGLTPSAYRKKFGIVKSVLENNENPVHGKR